MGGVGGGRGLGDGGLGMGGGAPSAKLLPAAAATMPRRAVEAQDDEEHVDVRSPPSARTFAYFSV